MSYRIKNEIESNDEFQATYKGYSVHVKREGCPEDIDIDWDGLDEPPSDYWTGPDDGMAFYLVVRSEAAFGTACECWWGNADNTIEEAVEEALIGSCLIDESQRKFKVAP